MIPTWRAVSVRSSTFAVGAAVALVTVPMTVLVLGLGGTHSAAAPTAVDLGTADSFGVLAGAGVTNTGPTVIFGDLGSSPTAAITGFPPGTALGSVHAADQRAGQAQSDLTTAYNVLAGQASDEAITADLAGRTLTTGVYTASSSMGLTGEVTLDAEGDPSAVFVFQVGSTLTTSSGSDVTLTNGAQACNVFWQVGSSATLGTDSALRGTVVALTSISAATGATVEGRLLARTGAVTLDDNRVTAPGCATTPTDTTATGGPSDTATTTATTGPGGPSGSGTTGTTGPGGPSGTGTTAPGEATGGADADSAGPPPRGTDTDDATAPPPGGDRPTPSTPTGFPDTGDGGSIGDRNLGLLAGGALALGLAGGLIVWWRRHPATD